MADEKYILKPVSAIMNNGHCRLRRSLSDRPISNANVECFQILKASKGKENILISPPVWKMTASNSNQTKLTCLSKDNDSDGESLIEDELLFDNNNNEGLCDSTKQRISDHQTPPPSPTWNLKVLCNAVSPEIRRMQQEQKYGLEEGRSSSSFATGSVTSPSEENSHDCLDMSSQEAGTGGDVEVLTSRKDKSLGRLCDKFLSKYPEHPGNAKIEICLDEVAKDLAVERRRIYDIVNVLESVEIVSRAAKNKYIWHGKTNLPHTLVKLKVLAKQDKIAEQMKKLKDQVMEGIVTSACGSGKMEKTPVREKTEEDSSQTVLQRKDKSLGIMSQKFLMLFLVAKPKTVNLELSAKLLIDDPTIKHMEAAKFKTKIRRLYDIANILTSLGLIKKIHVTEYRGRKPAFHYIGPDVDDMHDVDMCCNDGCHRPSSRHSLLDCVRNEGFVQSMISKSFKPIRPAGSMEFDNAKVRADIKAKLHKHLSDDGHSISKNQSFDEICRVVEQERNRLIGSSSEPSSPIKQLDLHHELPERKEHKFVVPSISKHLSFDDHLLSSQKSAGITKAVHNIPGKIIHRPRAVQAHPKSIILCAPSSGNNRPRETIIVSRNGEVKAVSGDGHITRQSQMEQIMQVKIAKSSAQREIQFNKPPAEGYVSSIGRSLLHSPDYEMAILNETSPMPGSTFVNRMLKRNMVEVDAAKLEEKKAKLDLFTPPCGSTIKDSISLSRDSPSVALLTPRASGTITTLRRINSTPLQSTPSSSAQKSLPQIVVHRIGGKATTASMTPPTGGFTNQKIKIHVSNTRTNVTVTTPTFEKAITQVDSKHCGGKIIIPGTSFKSVGTTSTSYDSLPFRVIETHPSSSSMSSLISTGDSQTLAHVFSPPTPVSSPRIFTVPHSSSVDQNTAGFQKLTTTSSLPPSQHSTTSPFKVVIPSGKMPDGATATTTFLVRVPRSKFNKTASM